MLAAVKAETEVCWIRLECIDRCRLPVTTVFLVQNDKAKPFLQVPHTIVCNRALNTHERFQQSVPFDVLGY